MVDDGARLADRLEAARWLADAVQSPGMESSGSNSIPPAADSALDSLVEYLNENVLDPDSKVTKLNMLDSWPLSEAVWFPTPREATLTSTSRSPANARTTGGSSTRGQSYGLNEKAEAPPSWMGLLRGGSGFFLIGRRCPSHEPL